jgi:hypothetical protein
LPTPKQVNTIRQQPNITFQAAEVVIFTLSPVVMQFPVQFVVLLAAINLVANTGSASFTLRWRRNSLTGAQVGNTYLFTATPGATIQVPIMEVEEVDNSDALTYVLTVLSTGASANCTANGVGLALAY